MIAGLGMDGACLVRTEGGEQTDGSRPRFRETHRHVLPVPQWKKYRVYHSKIKMGFNLLMAPFCDAVHNGLHGTRSPNIRPLLQ